MNKTQEALKLALEALEYISSHYMSLPKIGCMALAAVEEALAEQPSPVAEPHKQQEPVERGVLRFYTNGIERQHWKADGSIDFKDEQGNVTMTLASGEIEAPIGLYALPASKPWVGLTDEERGKIINANFGTGLWSMAKDIEAKLREKNNG